MTTALAFKGPVEVTIGTQTVSLGFGESTGLANVMASNAAASAAAAALSEAAAEALVGPIYASTAAGITATVNGDFFPVDNGDGTVSIYENVSGVATLRYSLATTAALASEDADKGAELVSGAFRVVRLTDHGFSPLASAADNLTAFKAALLACTNGTRLWLPPASDPYLMDYSGGWPNAPEIDKRIEFVCDGDLQADGGATIETNPNYLLNITAQGVKISGSGRIIGDGTIDDTNSGTDETFPGLIRVAADDFEYDGVELVTPPKVGIMLYQCYSAKIGGRFTGGPTEYGGDNGTGYYAIRAAGGGNHRFQKPRFYPDASGGMFVQCIMYSSSDDNLIEGAYAKDPYEKLLYGYGDRNRDVDCRVEGNPGAIPGTNLQGTITDVIRYNGSDNKSENLLATDVAAGVQCQGGPGNQVINPRILRCGQSGVSMNSADLSGSKVVGGTITKGALIGGASGDGIRIAPNAGSSNVEISGADVSGFSVVSNIENIPEWSAGASIPNLAIIKPTAENGNGRYYRKEGGGDQTTGVTEPSWNATPGSTTTDNGISWVAIAYEGGQAEIRLIGAGTGADALTKCRVFGNMAGSGQYGVKIENVTHSDFGFNITDTTSAGCTAATSSYNTWAFNKEVGSGEADVQGLDATSTQFRPSAVGTATYDPPSLADGDGATTTVALTEAVVGDFVLASFSHSLTGVLLTAEVSAAGVVSVRFQNETGGTVDLASGTLRVRAIK